MRPHHPPSARGPQTRRRIIESAARIFNQHGYAGTAISELMQATGLCKGGIYRHFSGKEELAVEAFRYAWEKAMLPRRAELKAKGNSLGLLRRMVESFVHRAPADIPGGCPLMNTAVDADDTNPALLAATREALREWRGILETIVKDGQSRGEIDPAPSACTVAAVLISSLEGALLICRIERTRTALHIAEAHLNSYIATLSRPLKRKPRTLAQRSASR